MKLLVLALTIALLFTAGESVADSPLSKHHLCCRATGSWCFLCHGTGAQSQKDLSDNHTRFFSLCNRSDLSEKSNYWTWKTTDSPVTLGARWIPACVRPPSSLYVRFLGQTKTGHAEWEPVRPEEKDNDPTMFLPFLFPGEALSCHQCLPKRAGENCELAVETCKPGKDGCAAVRFLRAPREFPH